MNRRARIGELLSRIVPLSGHDVEEILQEQSSNRRKFGEIALAWGLCQPEHVWDAWCQQGDQEQQPIDLERVGVDARAVAMLPAEVARKLGVLPVRSSTDVALIAIAEPPTDAIVQELAAMLHRQIKFLHVSRDELDTLIHRYYPLPV